MEEVINYGRRNGKNIKTEEAQCKQALKKYLSNYLIPDRNQILEDLICDIAKEGFLNVDWVEIY